MLKMSRRQVDRLALYVRAFTIGERRADWARDGD
jgi:hypothetical protein